MMSTANSSLGLSEWPDADRQAWVDACRPAVRLIRGGPAGHLSEITRADYANRYGAFLGFLDRCGSLRRDLPAAALVTSDNVDAYLTDLRGRLSSVSQYNCISMLRRVAIAIAPGMDFGWLREIEDDLKFLMQPRAKFDRLVTIDRLVEAGLALIVEAERFKTDPVIRAIGVRNGLIIALLALCHIRLKNFAALEIDRTFRNVNGTWWVTIPQTITKTKTRPIEKPFPRFVNRYIELYLQDCRSVLLRDANDRGLWISSTTGRTMTKKPLGTLISKITQQTLGVDVSPHLFRHAAASTAAAGPGTPPGLASAMLGHTDSRITEEHYIRPRIINAARMLQAIVDEGEF